MKKIFQFGYMANIQTKQVHRLRRLEKKCNVNRASRNMRRGTLLWAWYLIHFRGYDGCHYCYDKKDAHNLKRNG